MSWEKEYEHWRDCGHTWGPGIDDRRELTEEEFAAATAKRKAYAELEDSVRVLPSAKSQQAMAELEMLKPSSQDISSGAAPWNWRDKYNEAKLTRAQSIARSMGYELKLQDWKNRDEHKFMVSVEFHGYIPDKGGNIHDFSVVNIENIKDCLQLVADFSELGYWPTTWYQKNHISLKNTGELRLEMRRWGFPLENDNKASLDSKIHAAEDKAKVDSSSEGLKKEMVTER